MKEPVKYVIAAQPERPGSKYWSEDGKKVLKQMAAEFSTFGDAEEFADRIGIKLDGAMNYIAVK